MWFLASLVGLVAITSVSHAETAIICDQKVDYKAGQSAEVLSDEAKALVGIWDGEVVFDLNARMCAGWLIEDVAADGKIRARYAYSSATSAIHNVVKMGVSPFNTGRFQNGAMIMPAKRFSYELRKAGDNELQGYFLMDGRRLEAKFIRRRGPYGM